MKKMTCVVLVAVALLVATPLSALAGGPHGGFHAGVRVGGPGWGWGPHHWWGPRVSFTFPFPYPYPYVYPYYTAPVVVQQAPTTYVQQAPPEEPYYWYYCQDTQTYYPYVKQCPSAWLKVVPAPTPPAQ